MSYKTLPSEEVVCCSFLSELQSTPKITELHWLL